MAEPRDPELLEASRASERREFVWRAGVLRFGLPWAVAMAVFRYFFRPESGPFPGGGLERLAVLVAFQLPFGALAGRLFGRLMWRDHEKRNRLR